MKVREVSIDAPPALVHAPWRAAFPWLIQGCTTRGPEPERPFDLGLFSDASPARHVLEHWQRLRAATGQTRVVHAQQVHGANVRFHLPGPPGLHICETCDGHVTAEAGVLVGVSTADCVPIFVVDPKKRAVAALHAVWRGAASGVLERGLEVMQESVGSDPARIHLHLGPAICGDCYEVGSEVFEALEQPVPANPAPIDLRAVLAQRAVDAGVAQDQITVSEHCTRCGESGLFSHRGGDRERQVGYIGIRA